MTTSTTPQAPPAPAKKKRRGLETAVDMLRSLLVVLLLVVPMWWLARPPASDEAEIRRVDQAPDVRAWTSGQPEAPVPTDVPDDWVPTVSQLTPGGLRLGWNTAGGDYAEFAATSGPAEDWVPTLTGVEEPSGTLDVDGRSWDRYEDEDGSVSLVQSFGGFTVVVGSLRASASDAELVALARGVAPAA